MRSQQRGASKELRSSKQEYIPTIFKYHAGLQRSTNLKLDGEVDVAYQGLRIAKGASILVTASVLSVLLVLLAGSVGALAQPVRIEYWFSETSTTYQEAMQDIVDQFNQEQNEISVELVTGFSSKNDFWEKFTTAVAAGLAPDLVYGDGEIFVERGLASGAFLPIESLTRENLDAIDFLPGPKQVLTTRGKWWGLPFRTDARGLFFNQDMFDDVGLDSTKGPEDTDELDAYAQRLTKRDSSGEITQLGFVPWRNNDHSGLLYLWLFGGDYFDWEGLAPALNRFPENYEAVEWLKSYSDLYGPVRPATSWFTDGLRQAMRIDSTTRLGIMLDQDLDMHFSVGKLPAPKDGVQTNLSSAMALGVPNGSDNAVEAAKFALWMVSEETQLMWYERVRSLPIRLGVVRQLGNYITDPREMTMVEALPTSRTPAPLVYAIRPVFESLQVQMFNNEVTPQYVIDETQRQVAITFREVFGHVQ